MLTGTKSMKYSELLSMINEIMNNQIELKISPAKSSTHYRMSPYSFNPKLAKKLINNPHIDLGQGILNLIGEIHNEYNKDSSKD